MYKFFIYGIGVAISQLIVLKVIGFFAKDFSLIFSLVLPILYVLAGYLSLSFINLPLNPLAKLYIIFGSVFFQVSSILLYKEMSVSQILNLFWQQDIPSMLVGFFVLSIGFIGLPYLLLSLGSILRTKLYYRK